MSARPKSKILAGYTTPRRVSTGSDNKHTPLRASPQAVGKLSLADVAGWDATEVGRWLERVGLERYKDEFRAQEVEGKGLCELAHMVQHDGRLFHAVLSDDIGISCLGDRLRLAFELRHLAQ